MKRISLLISVLMLLSLMLIFGCDMGSGNGGGTSIDYNKDVEVVAPQDITLENFTPSENETYYTSKGLTLWAEINGEFLKIDYFTLDGNKRVYDNLYLYKDDYFFMLTDDNTDMYASLKSPTNEYLEEEKQQGQDVQINVKKSGIYKIIFDVDTLKFDLEYKSEIETPVYYTIKNCSIYSIATSWVEMSLNPENSEEFYISNFNIEKGKTISFFNNIHVSNYKVTLDEKTNEKYAHARKTSVTVNIGGSYDVYINSKTYEVRLELKNPDSASYGCVYYDGADFITLEPYDISAPYIFKYTITAEKYDSVPSFYSSAYREYALGFQESDILTARGSFKNDGTYNVTINLKTFEILVEAATE